MGYTQLRGRRQLAVVATYATQPDAPTLEQVKAEAAPLVAQLLAQVFVKRRQQRQELVSPRENA